jgi:NAD(P)-dependent dehydrogenase (short-subunit alcohol dehydrogenase family)
MSVTLAPCKAQVPMRGFKQKLNNIMSRVKDKVALITGGASGLGLASGKLLLEEGAKVIFTDKDSKSLNQIPELIDVKYRDFYSLKELDVTSEKNWQNVLSTAMDEYKAINVLLNSAGISIGADITSTSFEVWKKVHEVNLDGVFLGCKYALPHMANSGKGSIINISSISGIVAGWNTAAYNSSKAGVRHLSKSIALYCGKKDIDVRCNSVHPAFVNTPILDPMKQAFGDKEAIEKLSRQIPIKKIGDTDDVAYAVLYLASDESKFMTGAEIVLDGGLSAM